MGDTWLGRIAPPGTHRFVVGGRGGVAGVSHLRELCRGHLERAAKVPPGWSPASRPRRGDAGRGGDCRLVERDRHKDRAADQDPTHKPREGCRSGGRAATGGPGRAESCSARCLTFSYWCACMIRCAGSRTIPGVRRSMLDAALQVGELAGLHDPLCRFQEDEVGDGLEPSGLHGPVAADHEPAAVIGELVGQEPPERIGGLPRSRPSRIEGVAAQVERRAQAQEALRLQRCDLPPGGLVGHRGEVVPD